MAPPGRPWDNRHHPGAAALMTRQRGATGRTGRREAGMSKTVSERTILLCCLAFSLVLGGLELALLAHVARM